MIRVVIVDDNETVRDGFRFMLERVVDIEVVGEAEDGREAIALAHKKCPDVMTIDIDLPHLDGLKATQQIRSRRANTRVVIVSSAWDEDLVRQALQHGAKGYVRKREAYEELVPAIRTVHKGKHYYSASIYPLVGEIAHKVP